MGVDCAKALAIIVFCRSPSLNVLILRSLHGRAVHIQLLVERAHVSLLVVLIGRLLAHELSEEIFQLGEVEVAAVAPHDHAIIFVGQSLQAHIDVLHRPLDGVVSQREDGSPCRRCLLHPPLLRVLIEVKAGQEATLQVDAVLTATQLLEGVYVKLHQGQAQQGCVLSSGAGLQVYHYIYSFLFHLYIKFNSFN